MRNFFRRGQITLLAVILGVLGLTLGLSVASRSLSDLRQASTVDFGTKALAAAEAGVEYGLNLININGAAAVNCVFTPVPGVTFPASLGISSLTYEICQSGNNFAQSLGVVARDDVFQVDFTGAASPTSFDVWWTDADGIEISALSTTYNVSRYAYRHPSSSVATSFDMAPGCGSFCGDVTFPSSNRYCGRVNTGPDVLLLRVKPIENPGNVLVCPVGGVIPPQYYNVTANAVTTNGTTKVVTVRRDISGTLPGIFDNVLYSGGSISK